MCQICIKFKCSNNDFVSEISPSASNVCSEFASRSGYIRSMCVTVSNRIRAEAILVNNLFLNFVKEPYWSILFLIETTSTVAQFALSNFLFPCHFFRHYSVSCTHAVLAFLHFIIPTSIPIFLYIPIKRLLQTVAELLCGRTLGDLKI
jgi:uncharacterized membrane protein